MFRRPDAQMPDRVLHQNRVDRGVNAKNAVRESHLPAFMDLVVWGHEHECRPNTEDLRNPDNAVQNKVSKVLQPGSSVATSLSEGEAKRKHIFLLEVLNNSYRIISYQLRSVRPFAFESVVLKEAAEVKVEEPDSVSTFLEEKVVSLIDRLATEQPPMEGCPPMLPLVRLRVDYTGFSTINAQRFGQKFVNRVANPQDLLVWHKAPVRKARPDGSSRGVDESDEMLRPEQLDQQRIEDLVAANLHDSLRFLHEDDLAAALHDFVEKDDKTALLEVLQASLRETARPLMADAEALGAMPDDDSVIEQALQDAVQQRRDAKAAHPSGAGPSSVRDPPPALEVSYLDPGAGGKDAPGTVAYAARDGGDRIEDFDDGGGTGTNTSAGSMLPPKGRGTLTHTHIGTGTGAGSMLPPKGRGSRGGRGGAKAAAAPKSRAKPDTAARGKGAKASPAATPAGPSLRQPNLFEAFSASQQPSGASRQDAVPLDDNDDDGGGVVDDAHSDGDDDFISDGDGDDGYAPSGSKAKPRGGASASKRGGAAAAAATPVRSQRSKAASRGGGAAGTPASGRAGVAQAADPIEVNSDGDGDAGFSVGAGGSAAGGSAAGGATPGVTQGRVATGGTTQTTQGGTRKRPASFMSTSQAKPGTQGKKNWGSAR
ncbi:hypothetical protein FOA52_008873 [Chlamydomonas sp. UWO 241]|nr:hypothetical protein FOA52_008873 [Chlamydomonas sp. UWO 241]